MIKNMISDLKLTAMDIATEVKDTLHDMSTTLPSEVPITFNDESKNQNIQNMEMNYMNGWNTAPSQMTALRIDMIAEKINFVSDMIQQGLLSFDAIEVELQNCARGNVPPQPNQLMNMATRIDSNQKQIFMGLQKLKELSVEIDRATDRLQGTSPSGWGNKNIGGNW